MIYRNGKSSDWSGFIRKIKKALKKQGWEWEGDRRHYKVTAPNGTQITIARTPSDWRARKNVLAELRRAGFVSENPPYSEPTVYEAFEGLWEEYPEHDPYPRRNPYRRMNPVYRNQSAAVEHYEEFHGAPPDRIQEKKMWVPGGLVQVGSGEAIDVGYEIGAKSSSKGKNNLYVHDFGGGVKIYRRAKKNEKPTKTMKNFPTECMVLGYNIGFSYKDKNGRNKEVKGSRGKKLAVLPDKKTLVIIGSKGVEYLMTGGAMHVSDWIFY
jgi:hypothetical protein